MGAAARVALSNVPEFYVECLGHIEEMSSGVSRHVLMTKRFVGSKILLIPHVCIIMPDANIPDAILKASRRLALGMRGVAEPAFN
jgi:hypothetical protein